MNRNALRNIETFSILKVGFLTALAFIGTSTHSLASQPERKPKSLSPSENWVLTKIRNGEPADLAEKFVGEEDRVLSPSFIDYLFQNAGKEFKVNPRGMEIRNAITEDKLDLSSTSITCSVVLDGWHFKKTLLLTASKVQGNLVLKKSIFDEVVGLGFMKVFGDLDLSESTFYGGATFLGTQVDGYLSLDSTHFMDSVYFGNVKTAVFSAAKADFASTQGFVIFTNMQAGRIEFSLDSFKGSPDIAGMTYQEFFIDDKSIKDDPRKLLMLCQKAEFSRLTYAQAEAFLREHARTKEADEIFISGKERERASLGWLAWSGNILLYALVGYGREARRTLYYGVAFVVLGYLVFRRRDRMKPRKPEDASRRYSPFWYSVDLFAPVINLKIADTWEPTEDRWFARNYVHVQRILGWILVPIFFGVWTGIIK